MKYSPDNPCQQLTDLVVLFQMLPYVHFTEAQTDSNQLKYVSTTYSFFHSSIVSIHSEFSK